MTDQEWKILKDIQQRLRDVAIYEFDVPRQVQGELIMLADAISVLLKIGKGQIDTKQVNQVKDD